MSGVGEDREVEYDDDSFIASPVASLVSSHNESPAESPVGTPAVSPLNSPPKPQKQLRHGIAFKFPKPKWLWKRSTSVIHFRGQQKLDPDSALDVGAVGRGIWTAG